MIAICALQQPPEIRTAMGNGIILGRFMPPHEGHVALVRTATYLVDRLTIVLA